MQHTPKRVMLTSCARFIIVYVFSCYRCRNFVSLKHLVTFVRDMNIPSQLTPEELDKTLEFIAKGEKGACPVSTDSLIACSAFLAQQGFISSQDSLMGAIRDITPAGRALMEKGGFTAIVAKEQAEVKRIRMIETLRNPMIVAIVSALVGFLSGWFLAYLKYS